jgi:hypothetical protein
MALILRIEKKVVRRIYGSKNKEVLGRLRNLHSKELLNLSSSADISIVIIKEDEMQKAAYSEEKRNAYNILTGKHDSSSAVTVELVEYGVQWWDTVLEAINIEVP